MKTYNILGCQTFDYFYDLEEKNHGTQQIILPNYVVRMNGIKNKSWGEPYNKLYGFFIYYEELFRKSLFCALYNFIKETNLQSEFFQNIRSGKKEYVYKCVSLLEPEMNECVTTRYWGTHELRTMLEEGIDVILPDLYYFLKTLSRN